MISNSDRLLLAAARRDLRYAPRILGSGRADSLRSAPFSAKYPGVCPRCHKRIAVSNEIRYHADHPTPVHVGCREAGVLVEPRTKPIRPKANPVCPRCWTEHAGDCL